MLIRFLRYTAMLSLAAIVGGFVSAQVVAQEELSYAQYRKLSWVADRLGHMAKFEPLHGQNGMFFAFAERWGTVQVIKVDSNGSKRVWKSNQLSGVPEEVLAADLDGDSLEDSFVCRTTTGKLYAWSMDGYDLLWESLSGEYQTISCFTIANMDEDPASEIVMVADNRVVYIDGTNFNKQFTSSFDYEATQIRCADVDGDSRIEIVLNTGKVLDSFTGDVEWEGESFFAKIELMDIDGDGIPEVITENPGGGPVKAFDVGHQSEVRFQ
ncbi:MAG: hypothetical protein ACI9UK_000528 [Candidatus Krumholzibacteriia bacterium]|jgi:hypothetical protein